MKPFRTGAGVVLLILAGIQFIPRAPENKAVAAGSSFAGSFAVPDTLRQLLTAACFDCHSNTTRYPWYSRVQPINRIMAAHIKKGKEKLNFDEIARYGARKQRSKFGGIIHALQDGTMPLWFYSLLHRDLTAAEKTTLIRYFTGLKDIPGRRAGKRSSIKNRLTQPDKKQNRNETI
ncbi:heme-binding domain-containing protein [Niabella aurantiaca]|uniref:heme-binding domain-containing protein n=1 Tax=Niabella aurantiaca TaxID=379900 RepID=UPI000377120E|nr:heme-binding domain-containing protein [Niabella aurantiaca]